MRLTNVVVSSDLHCDINLYHLARLMKNCVYNPSKYSGMILRNKKIKSTCFLFRTGRILCMGNNSVVEAKKDLRKYARIIQKMDYSVYICRISVVTKSAVATLSGKLDLYCLAKFLPSSVSYEPELFHAALVKDGKVNFTCFKSGKIIITGVKNIASLYVKLAQIDLFTPL